jgi:hypothetical protein
MKNSLTPAPVMIEVTQQDGNDFCRILTALGMEEEGDVVAEVERLVVLRDTTLHAKDAEIAALKKQVWMYEVCSNTHGCAELHRNAGRYQLLRRGQRWSVIDGVGDTLRAEALDAAVDTAIAQAVQPS